MIAVPQAPLEIGSATRWTLVGLAAIGAVAAAAGAALEPQRMWANWLLVSYYTLTLSLGGLCFVAIHYASGATWAVALRRAPEALAVPLPIAAAALGIVLLARPQLYPWTAGDFGTAPELAFKRAWLDPPFFLARAIVYAVAWTGFAWAILRQSRLQDRDGSERRTAVNRRLSGAFLAVFAVTFSLAAFDWVMSLEPDWYSTIFGVYHFAGLLLAALAAVTLIALWLERAGPLAGILRDDHLHDLGKLIFAFSTFWAYIWFSQYMLIWYANIPEETSHLVARTHGGWLGLFAMNVVLNWAIPFAALLRRDAKRSRRVLAAAAGIVLLGRWLDLYLMIMPPILGEHPRIGVWELALFAGGIGLFGFGLAGALRGRPMVPGGDPGLEASLRYEA